MPPLKNQNIDLQEKNSGYALVRTSNFSARHQRYLSPRLTQATTSFSDRRSSNYWTNSVTTQSYGQGKWGTLYYWDVQGNLRETKGFIDIAGKNKRGLKLVFPWR
ncbi:MAG TPA: hypothetical protein VIS49_15120 [Cyclobacteriaceae bacterium]